jgi:CRISPR/Cas system-associated exonuclease Cas4 (RecB family)
MNERIVICPHDSLVKTVVDQLPNDIRDYSRIALVFPGKRPAHFIRKELAVHVGASFIPPKIFSIDDFVLSLFQQLFTETCKDLEPMDAIALLYRVHTGLSERLGGEHFTVLDEFLPLGIKLLGELEELCLAHLPDRRIEEELGMLTHNRLFSLQAYYKQFYALVKESGYATRAMRYAEVADRVQEIDLEKYSKIVIAGLFKQTHSEQIIFQEIEKRPNVWMVYQSDKRDENAPEPEIHYTKASDTHGQVFALSACVERQVKDGTLLDEHSVIVLPAADSLFPVYHQTLSLLDDEEYNIALGYPIVRTPIFGFFNNLLELLATKQNDAFSASSYTKFILHPYTKNIRWNQRTDVTRILFHMIETKLTGDVSKKLMTLNDVEQAEDVFTNVAFVLNKQELEITLEQLKQHIYTIHNQTIRAFDQLGSLTEFAQKSIALLSYMYEESTARLHPLFRRYAETMIEVFQRVEHSLIGNVSFRDVQGYLTFLRQYVGMQEVPFAGTPLRGLQVLGMLETRGLQFDDVYILNVNDEILPGSPTSDMLLPQQLRERLGLETRRDRDALKEYYFNLLVRSAKRVHLFYTDAGDATKSRFVEKLLWEEEKKKRSCSSEEQIKTVHYTLKLANELVAPLEKSEQVMSVLRGFSFSASALDTYLRCPLQFYYCYLLKLKEKDEASDDLEAKDVGKFVHAVLKKYYERLVDVPLKSSDLDGARMEGLTEELFTETFGKEPGGAVFLLKQQIQRRLKKYLTEYQAQVLKQGPVIIRALEKKLTALITGINCEGRIDRIEERGNTHVILDYKTGVNPKKKPIRFDKLDFDDRTTWSDAVHSLQLPLYLLLYRDASRLPAEQIMPAYLYLGEKTITMAAEVSLYEDKMQQMNELHKIEEFLARLFQEILDANISFQAPKDVNASCPGCPMKPVCGTQWVQR